jgi:predicted N-formylglutamate amidohydrolase
MFPEAGNRRCPIALVVSKPCTFRSRVRSSPEADKDAVFLMKEFKPYHLLAGNHDNGMVILGDHAMNLLPERYGRLGLPESALSRHIAYDIGIEGLCRRLSAMLDVPAVLGGFSRLLIDPNRGEDDPTLIMKISDRAIVPGNHPITDAEWEHRIETFHRPYHRAVAETIAGVATSTGRAPLVLSLHSFTNAWRGVERPWHATVLWDSDDRAVHPLLSKLRENGDLVIGDNEPYDGALRGDTMYRHCMVAGIPHALLEVRQDLIGDDAGIAEWAERLAPIFEAVNADPACHEFKIYPSRTGPYRTT